MKKSRLVLVMVLLAAIAGLMGARGPLIARDAVVVVDLGGRIPESVPWNPIMSLFQAPEPTVLDKLMLLKEAAKDGRVKAVVARIETAGYSFGKAQEFRAALERLRASGKPVYAYLELEGGGNIEYYVASACDKIYLSPASTLGLTGLATFRFYLGGLWDKIYVDVQVDQIAEYKSAADMIARRDMSQAEREVQNAILDSLYDQFLTGISQGRKVSKEKAAEWVDAAWFIPEKYEEAGAIDGIKYLDEIVAEAGGKAVPERDYGREISMKKRLGGPRVAVIYGVGNIVSGEAPTGPFSTGSIMASGPMVRRFEKALDDDSIAAVIFRVDSGGGSALASDLIWRATQRVKLKKPVVVSMSDVAGSGGYYVSCGASSIVAQPGTITGSIGILTAQISLGKLLEKIQVGTAVIGRGKYSEMGRLDRRATADEMAKVHDTIASLYDLFTSRVGAGRGMQKDAVNEIGRGRIWTGEQAKKIGLVDKLGGFEEAIAETKRLLGVPAGKEVELVYGHEPVTFWKLITGRVSESVEAMVLAPHERELVHALRAQGLWAPGTPLAVMPEPAAVR
ncbi:MAG TPA: signal peptide peptidase SppA [bacterium]|nr:signal peptide peptidase SppA [bacterium]